MSQYGRTRTASIRARYRNEPRSDPHAESAVRDAPTLVTEAGPAQRALPAIGLILDGEHSHTNNKSFRAFLFD